MAFREINPQSQILTIRRIQEDVHAKNFEATPICRPLQGI